jgi:hypothetical protein
MPVKVKEKDHSITSLSTLLDLWLLIVSFLRNQKLQFKGQ